MAPTSPSQPTLRRARWTPAAVARRGLLIAGSLALIAAVACGGGSKKGSSSSGSGDSSSSGSSSSSSSSGSAGVAAGKLADLSSYRYTLHMEGNGEGGPLADLRDSFGGAPGQDTPSASQTVSFDVSGAYVKPDKAQWKMKIGSLEVGQTVIGPQQWVTFGGLTQGPSSSCQQSSSAATPSASSSSTPAAGASSSSTPASASCTLDPGDLSLAAAIWDDSNFSSDVGGNLSCSGSKESVNGVSTHKCGIDQKAFAALQSQLGGFFEDTDAKNLKNFELQLWLADQGGYPAKLSITMAGTDTNSKDYSLKMELDVTDANKSIDISAPK